MIDVRRATSVGWRLAAVAAAFVLGAGGARLLGGWEAYHRRPAIEGVAPAACRAVVERMAGEAEGRRRLDVRILTGDHKGATLPATQTVAHLRERGRLDAGERCLVAVEAGEGAPRATVCSRERDGVLAGLAAALVVVLMLTAGRRGLATVASVAWAMLLLTGLLLPAAARGADAAVWCVPLALAIAVPTLLAIGGCNRKSVAAIGGTLCGVVAGGALSVAAVHAMQLTGLDIEFGRYAHLDNRLWFAPLLRQVDFGSLLVAGLLLAGLGAVMDVSMAVASTVAEVGRAEPQARGRELFVRGLAAGRDILGVMVFTVALVFVGSHLMFLVSVSQTAWADQWLLLGNYEELAAELARLAAAAVGMAVCIPASAGIAAVLHRTRSLPKAPMPSGGFDLGQARGALRPLVALAACLVVAGLADEWALRTWERSETSHDTAARVVDFDEPVAELYTRTSDPHDRGYFRSQLVVVQPFLGPHAGRRLASRMLLGPNPTGNLALRRGTVVRASIDTADGAPDVKLMKPPLRYRWGLVAAMVVVAVLVVAGGRVGLRVLLVMAAAAVLMVAMLVPLLATGWAPAPATMLFCVLMLGAAFAISGGVDRKGLVAIAGCMVGLIVAGLLLAASSWWLELTGRESVTAQFLVWVEGRAGAHYNYQGLVAASLLVALFGLALDTAVTVAAGVVQVCGTRPDVSRTDACAAGLNIARDVVGTMVLTMVFAFVGLHLPVMLLSAAVGASPAELLNGEAGASAVLHVLVGAIALAATGPATAWLAARWLTGGTATRSADAPVPTRRGWRTAVAVVVGVATLVGAVAWWRLSAERRANAKPWRPGGDVVALIDQERAALRGGRLGDCLVALWHARRLHPRDARLHTELAYACMTGRWLAQARRHVDAALAAGAKDGKVHYVAGVVCLWMGQRQEAERHLRRTVELQPHNTPAREALERLTGK